MSINSDMKLYALEKNMPSKTDSGAKKPNWGFVEDIYVTIRKKSDLIITQSARYNEATHIGLTHYKELKEGKYRLVKKGTTSADDVVYNIIDCNPEGKFSAIILKVVDADV